MGSRFKDRELGAIEADKRGVAEAGDAGGVCCFNIGNFCVGAGCRSASPNGVISSDPRFDSGRKHVNSNSHGFEHIDPQSRALKYCF